MNKVELELLLMLPSDNRIQCTIIQQFIQQSVVLFSIFDKIHLFATSINKRKTWSALQIFTAIYELCSMEYTGRVGQKCMYYILLRQFSTFVANRPTQNDTIY